MDDRPPITDSKPLRRGVVYWIMCAAPPVQEWLEPAVDLQQDGWDLWAIPTPMAAVWLDVVRVADITGHPVRSRPLQPDENEDLPDPDAVLVAPATFNTLNRWAMGVNNSLALTVLNEMLGRRVPIVVATYLSDALAAHPAYRTNVTALKRAGATILEGTDSITVRDGAYSWDAVRDALAERVPPGASHVVPE